MDQWWWTCLTQRYGKIRIRSGLRLGRVDVLRSPRRANRSFLMQPISTSRTATPFSVSWVCFHLNDSASRTDRSMPGAGERWRPTTERFTIDFVALWANHLRQAEPVKDFETTTYDFFCTSVSIVGLLIHAAVGSLGGLGRRLPNRHGLAA
jgi:hypothetical protein